MKNKFTLIDEKMTKEESHKYADKQMGIRFENRNEIHDLIDKIYYDSENRNNTIYDIKINNAIIPKSNIINAKTLQDGYIQVVIKDTRIEDIT